MYELKTKPTDNSVLEFIESIDHPKKREDGYRLLDIFTETSGYEPKMWGPSIIGFGSYHYKYESGHEGDAPLVGFSPKKTRHSLYMGYGDPKRDEFLERLGKYKTGKSCVYINKLEDIDVDVLKEFITWTIEHTKAMYPEE